MSNPYTQYEFLYKIFLRGITFFHICLLASLCVYIYIYIYIYTYIYIFINININIYIYYWAHSSTLLSVLNFYGVEEREKSDICLHKICILTIETVINNQVTQMKVKSELQEWLHRWNTLRSHVHMCQSLSCVQLFATPWTVSHQTASSKGFSRQEYWSGKPFPYPGDLLDPGIELWSPVLQADSLPSETPGIN